MANNSSKRSKCPSNTSSLNNNKLNRFYTRRWKLKSSPRFCNKTQTYLFLKQNATKSKTTTSSLCNSTNNSTNCSNNSFNNNSLCCINNNNSNILCTCNKWCNLISLRCSKWCQTCSNRSKWSASKYPLSKTKLATKTSKFSLDSSQLLTQRKQICEQTSLSHPVVVILVSWIYKFFCNYSFRRWLRAKSTKRQSKLREVASRKAGN